MDCTDFWHALVAMGEHHKLCNFVNDVTDVTDDAHIIACQHGSA